MANQFGSSTLTATLSILKNWYAGAIVSQLNDEIPFYGQMEKGNEKAAGLQVVRAVKVRRNQGIGATSDGGPLPAIGVQTTQNATISYKYNYLRFGVTGPMMKAAASDKGAFASIVDFEMREGMTDLKNDVNRQIFWDGTSDLAVVSANAVSSNVITVTGRESTEDGSKYLDIGQVIDIVTAAGAPVATGVAITGLTGTTTATLTLSVAVTTNATDVVVRGGAYNNEIQGLLYTIDGGTSSIYGIDRSVYPTFQSNAISASGGQLTLNLMQQAYNEARRRGGGRIDCIYSDFDSERFYNRLLVSDKRYVGVNVVGDGTFAAKDKSYLEYAGVALVPDKDSPQRFWFLDSKTWKKYVLGDLEWASETGSEMIAQPAADAFESRLRMLANIFCEKPSANAVLKSYISP